MFDEIQLEPGRPAPLGAHVRDGGVNVAVVSEAADVIELCLFDERGGERRIALASAHEGVWHGFVHGPKIGPGLVYGFRARGPWDPARGHRFDPHKLLLDPRAREIVGRFEWSERHFAGDTRDSAPHMIKARVAAPLPGTPSPHVRVAPADTILYELHVKGFSRLSEGVPAPLRGTYTGLAHPANLEHLQRLGVTTLSLMPVHYALPEQHLARRGLPNYWGYNTIAWFCPDPRLSSRPEDPTATRAEFRAMVDALHAAGFEVVLDVVYNHSAEAGEGGPILSLRGLDNALYYRLERLEAPQPGDHARSVNWSGCGNTLDFGQPRVVELAVDSLRYWVAAMGVDGFRFDLAPVLGRGSARSSSMDGAFDRASPFFEAIANDPILAGAKLIAEPWDLGPEGYQLGAFPAGWLEYNDRFRDGIRHTWLKRGAGRGELARRLSGSSDRFRHRGRRPSASINFITAHDGFTLADLVSYSRKHNRENGEDNRDGHDHDISTNCGVEGPSDDPEIVARRARLRRALIATLFVSRGTPMLLAGDELGHSQGGNNNAYCQDNETTWLDWAAADAELLEFVCACIALRREQALLRADRWLIDPAGDERDGDPVIWRRPDGATMTVEDWHDLDRHALVALLGEADEALLLVFNPESEPTRFALPAGRWTLRLASTGPRVGLHQGSIVAPAEAVLVLVPAPAAASQ